MSFKDLGLSDALVKAVEEKGYTVPTSIQQKAIPVILEGKDILASAQTGTGKTAGFTLPILQYLSETKHPPKNGLPVSICIDRIHGEGSKKSTRAEDGL